MSKKVFVVLFTLLITRIFGIEVWSNYTERLGTPIGVNFFKSTTDDILWFNSSDGLKCFDGERWKTWNIQNSNIYSDSVGKLTIENDSIIWSESWSNKYIQKFENGKFSIIDSNVMGLNYDKIYCPAIAPNGDKWFSTWDMGVIRFNGTEWTRFDTTNSTLELNYAKDIFFDSSGNVWFIWNTTAYEKGALSKFDGTNWYKYDKYNSLISTNYVNDIITDKDGVTWISFTLGIIKVVDTTWTLYDPKVMLGTTYSGSYSSQISKEGNLWFSGYKTYFKYNPLDTSWNYFDLNGAPLENETFPNLIVGLNDVLWFNTEKDGFYRFKDDTWVHFDTSNTISVDSRNKLRVRHVFNDGSILAQEQYLDYNDRLLKFDGDSTWIEYTAFNTCLADNNITSILTDQSNIKWIANEYGISKFDGEYSWNVIDTFEITEFPINKITTMVQDKDGNIWAGSKHGGTNSGLYKYSNGTWEKFDQNNSEILSTYIYDIKIDPTNNSVWFGTSSGLGGLQGSTWSEYSTINSDIPNNNVYAVEIDSNGNKWVGTQNGLAFINSQDSMIIYDSSNTEIPNNWITSLEIDMNGTLWIGTLAGLTSFNGAEWTTYTNGNSDLPHDYINTLKSDTFGNIWVGTNGGGVTKFNESVWTVYDTSNSDLLGNNISSIAIDKDGSKWFGTTDNGLSHLIDDDEISIAQAQKKNQSIQFKYNQNSIYLDLPNQRDININIYNLKGRLVKQISNANQMAGTHKIDFSKDLFSSGMYLVNINLDGKSFTKKIMIKK